VWSISRMLLINGRFDISKMDMLGLSPTPIEVTRIGTIKTLYHKDVNKNRSTAISRSPLTIRTLIGINAPAWMKRIARSQTPMKPRHRLPFA
jgi:hypothetical protein